MQAFAPPVADIAIGSPHRRGPHGGQSEPIAATAVGSRRDLHQENLTAGQGHPPQIVRHVAIEAAFEIAGEGVRAHLPLDNVRR